MTSPIPLRSGLRIDAERIAGFCRRWRVRQLALFGSALREDFGPGSDVDVLVDLEPGHGLTLFDWTDMIEELQAIFGRPVDLVSRTGLKNPFRRREILRTAQVIHAA